MKKRNDWLTRSDRRKIKKMGDLGILDFLQVKFHYFQDMNKWIQGMEDPRNASYITYTQSDLISMGLLKNICGVTSMNQMNEKFNEECCIRTLGVASDNPDLQEMPHGDTLNNYLEKLPPEELTKVRDQMISALIRMKSFYKYRLCGTYWRIILDGTGLFCFKERHCENDLVRTITLADGKKVTRYYHSVLEAKLVLAPNLVLSLDTEFIENEREDIAKQDCEVNAAKRLMARIKERFPRLAFCIQGDALYAAETLMEMCRKNGWQYIFTNKEARQRQLNEDFEYLTNSEECVKMNQLGKEKGVGLYVNHVEEVTGKPFVANMYKYSYEMKEKDGEKKPCTMQWITSIELTENNLEEMISAGRGRWKIENEGFNNQKNGIYDIEHLNSRNPNAMKNHYLLTQIADMIMQLYLATNKVVRSLRESIKNTSSKLLESFRRQTVSNEDVLSIKRYTTMYLE